jgi:hypothetical protein
VSVGAGLLSPCGGVPEEGMPLEMARPYLPMSMVPSMMNPLFRLQRGGQSMGPTKFGRVSEAVEAQRR